MNKLSNELEKLIFRYYKNYYQNELGLKDWKERVEQRLEEEKYFSQQYNYELLKSVYNYDFNEKKMLVAGSGTGGECVFFSKKNMQVFGIEPNKEANAISKLKIQELGIKNISISEGVLEDLPYKNNFFDLIYCYTVLEHVDNVAKSITEMIRVLKPGGFIFICTPDYRQFYEPHYKLPLPMFMPKFLVKILLKLINRPIKFLDSLNLYDEKYINKILTQQNVTSTRIYINMPEDWKENSSFQIKMIKFITLKFGIHKNQFWFIRKND